MRYKRSLIFAALWCALLCNTLTLHASRAAYSSDSNFPLSSSSLNVQDTTPRLWGFIANVNAPQSFSMKTDGSDVITIPNVGGGYLKLSNGEMILTNKTASGTPPSEIKKINASGLQNLYPLDYTAEATIVGQGMVEGIDRKIYAPYSFSATNKMLGVHQFTSDGTFHIRSIFTSTGDMSKDYHLISTPTGIYGVSRGDSNNNGFVYRLNADLKGVTVVYLFTGGADGLRPIDGLVVGTNGKFYGKTLSGGLNGKGIFFRVNDDGTGFTKLRDRANGEIDHVDGTGHYDVLLALVADGYKPVTDSNGNYYLATSTGIYKIGSTGLLIAKISNLANVDNLALVTPGFIARAGISNISNGATGQPLSMPLRSHPFPGATKYYFQISSSANFTSNVTTQTSNDSTTTVINLTNGTTYYVRVRTDLWPYYGAATSFTTAPASVVQSNRVWTFAGGDAISPMSSDSKNANDPHHFESTFFNPNDASRIVGAIPLANGEKIIIGGEGAFLSGEIFKLTASGVHHLYDIDTYPEYAYVAESMIDGGDGYVYALNFAAVTPAFSGIIRFKTDGTSYERYPGSQPALLRYSQITKTTNGIYGISKGSSNNKGFIFKLKTDLSGVDVVYNFTTDSLGFLPISELLQGRDGYLYGTTRSGGRYSAGVVFKVSLAGTNYQVLHHFKTPAGKNPVSKLAQDSNGWIYGVTPFGGGEGKGVLFKVFEDGTGFLVLRNFDSSDAVGRLSPLVAVDDNNVFAASSTQGVFKVRKDLASVPPTIFGGNFHDVWLIPYSLAGDTYVTSIEDGATNVPPVTTLSTKPMAGASWYEFQVSMYPFMQSDGPGQISPTTDFNAVMPANTLMYARVRSSLLPDYGKVITFTTGSPSARMASDFSVYPNPSKDAFSLRGDLSLVQSMTITESNGNVIYQYIHDGSSVQLDRIGENLPQGIYLLKIKTKEGTKAIRIVRQ